MRPQQPEIMTPRKEEIYQVAARLFQEKGYRATSVRDLARALGLKPSSLYSHIGGKEEILRKICFDNAERFLEGIGRVEAMQQASAAEQVRALIRLHIEVALHDITSLTVFNDEWRHISEPWLSAFKAMRRDYERRFRQIIERGIEAGEFKPLNPHTILYTILNAVRWLHYSHPAKRDITPQQLERDLLTLLMDGLLKEPQQ